MFIDYRTNAYLDRCEGGLRSTFPFRYVRSVVMSWWNLAVCHLFDHDIASWADAENGTEDHICLRCGRHDHFQF